MFSFKEIGIDTDVVLLISLVLILLLFILVIVLFAKNSGLKQRYYAFMGGSDAKTLEEEFYNRFDNMEDINEKLGDIEVHLNDIDRNLLKTYQKVGVVKYDAFQEMGGTLSFVLTLLTKDNDGILVNSVHSNSDGCYIFIKEVVKGETFVSLSTEEQESLDKALKNL